jgi:transcriptional regulator with XRE-family HTH domain
MIHTGHIASLLRDLRSEANLPRHKVSSAAGIHIDTLKNMENGKDHTISSLFSVLFVLQISPAEFFSRCQEEANAYT